MGSSGSRPAAPDDAAQSCKRSKKSKESILVPFLRSMSCGASSSHRSDSFMQESRTTSGDCLACQITSEKSAACDGQPGPCQLQSAGEDRYRKASDGGYGSMVSQQSSEHLSVPGIGESIPSCRGPGHSSIVVPSPGLSLLRQRSRNRYRHQTDHQANSIPRSRRPYLTHASTDETTDVYRFDPLSDQLTSEGNETNPVSSLGSSLRVEDTSGDVSELETSANPADWGGSSQHGPGLDGEASVVASSEQDTISTQQADDLGVLHVEALGLVAQTLDESSSLLRGESSGREARRNNRRRLWDALTRATSHRRRFSHSISHSILPPTEDMDSLNTWNDDWGLFDWNSSEENSLTDEGGVLARRPSDMEDRRWRSRPQVWALQHFSNSMEGSSGRSRHCAFGRHPNGHCSCEAFVMTEETSTRASISRIVMLAEALFEVLDEIHRQSVALSRSTSLSLVSLPAPEAVVDSFVVKIHKRADMSDYVLGQCAECYICLIEYEEGDHIRVLPCCHEFHMSCVDKWLKEVHRVCPLCRGNVCDETVRTSQAQTT